MGQLIELILRQPILALLVLGAVFQVIGKVMNKSGGRGRPATRPRGPSPAARPSPSVRRPDRPSESDIAAEMRRILGMEPQSAAPPPRRPTPQPSRDAARQERAPEPLRLQTLGNLGAKIEPHVGERMGQRRAPMSGAVGAQQLGLLGGRVTARARSGRPGSHLVDLTNLPRAIVLREIFDQPLGLRGHY